MRSGTASRRLVAFLTVFLVLLPACTSGGGDGSEDRPEPGESMPLRVFVYNVEYGGDEPPTR